MDVEQWNYEAPLYHFTIKNIKQNLLPRAVLKYSNTNTLKYKNILTWLGLGVAREPGHTKKYISKFIPISLVYFLSQNTFYQ